MMQRKFLGLVTFYQGFFLCSVMLSILSSLQINHMWIWENYVQISIVKINKTYISTLSFPVEFWRLQNTLLPFMSSSSVSNLLKYYVCICIYVIISYIATCQFSIISVCLKQIKYSSLMILYKKKILCIFHLVFI